MKITDRRITEDSALVAGITGYKVTQAEGVPAVEANHGWTLLLEAESAFRKTLEAWEKKINHGG